LYRNEVKPFRTVGGASVGRRWPHRSSWRKSDSMMAQRAIGPLRTMRINMVKACYNVQKKTLKIL